MAFQILGTDHLTAGPPERVWGDGTRWCIKRKPDTRRFLHPFVILKPAGSNPRIRTGNYFYQDHLDRTRRRRDYEMASPACWKEVGRFPTFEAACRAFAIESKLIAEAAAQERVLVWNGTIHFPADPDVQQVVFVPSNPGGGDDG
jgi:hypothetical protein